MSKTTNKFAPEVRERAIRMVLDRSLSEVARAITGTRWNGLRFFGLRQELRA